VSTEATPHPSLLHAPRRQATARASARSSHAFGGTSVLILYLLAAAGTGLAHTLLFGADFSVSALAVASVVVSVLPALRYGWRDMPSLICLVSGARYAATAIFAKAYMLDAIDNGLYAPYQSFLVVFAGLSALTLAAFAAHLLWSRRPVFAEQYSADGLKLLLAVGFIGAVGLILIGLPARPGITATGILNVEVPGGIRGLMTAGFAIVPTAWLAFNLKTGRPPLSAGFLLGMAALVLLSITVNIRLTATNLIAATTLFLVCFRVRVSPLLLGIAGAAVLFYALVISPAIIDVRMMREGGSSSSGLDFIAVTIEQIGKHLSGDVTRAPQGPVFNYYLKYLPNTNDVVSRLTSIQELDYVVALAGDQGTVGFEKLWNGLASLLPSGFVEDKSDFNPDNILWIYGALEIGFESQLEVTPFGNAFTYGGTWFVSVSMFVIFFVFFLFFRIFCPAFRNSVFATFFIANYFAFLTGGSVMMLVGILVRTLPFDALLFWAAGRIGTDNPYQSR
jgi:hypothetical protein